MQITKFFKDKRACWRVVDHGDALVAFNNRTGQPLAWVVAKATPFPLSAKFVKKRYGKLGHEAEIVVDTTLDGVRDVAAYCWSGKEAILRDVKVSGEELIQGNVIVKSPGTFVDALRYIKYHCRRFQDRIGGGEAAVVAPNARRVVRRTRKKASNAKGSDGKPGRRL